jgi:hypothetical protein
MVVRMDPLHYIGWDRMGWDPYVLLRNITKHLHPHRFEELCVEGYNTQIKQFLLVQQQSGHCI